MKPYERVKIECIETGLIFDSVTHAAEILGCGKSAIVNHLNRPERFPHIRGVHLRRLAVPSHEE